MIKRTRDEMTGLILGIEQGNHAVYLKELENYRDKVMLMGCNSTGEEAIRYWGMIKGLGICLLYTSDAADE